MRQHKKNANENAFSILTLDDDPIMTSTVQAYFQRSGYRVDTENDPQAAIERIRNGNYDILLLDFLMSPICGDQVVEQIRHVATSLNVGHLMLLLQYGNMSKDTTKYNSRLFAEKVMPKVKDLFGDWEDRWWPKPLARGERAAVPAFRPQTVAAE